MYIKTYEADTIQDALGQIKQDLGPNALILNTRRVTKSVKWFGLSKKHIIEVDATTPKRAVPNSSSDVTPILSEFYEACLNEFSQLKPCRDCQNPCSSSATTCPKCGCSDPTGVRNKIEKATLETMEVAKKSTKRWTLVVVGLMILASLSIKVC